jgi:hypothetical protein
LDVISDIRRGEVEGGWTMGSITQLDGSREL